MTSRTIIGRFESEKPLRKRAAQIWKCRKSITLHSEVEMKQFSEKLRNIQRLEISRNACCVACACLEYGHTGLSQFREENGTSDAKERDRMPKKSVVNA